MSLAGKPSAAAASGHGWLGNAVAAARIAADRSDLWPAGSLAAVVFAGWLPFVLATGRFPTVGDLAFFGASLALAPNYPLNVILLAAGLAAGIVVASVLEAAAEAHLLRGLADVPGDDGSIPGVDEAAARLWVVQLLASIPVAVAVAVTGLALISVAPGEYQAPDLGTPLVVRLLVDVAPYLVALAAATLAAQAFAAVAQRSCLAPGFRGVRSAARHGLVDLVRHPLRRLGVALATALALLAWGAATWGLLTVLWAPIGRDFAAGGLLGGSSGALLLVGFVAVWLCIVIAGGVLHTWASAWWSLEAGPAEASA